MAHVQPCQSAMDALHRLTKVPIKPRLLVISFFDGIGAVWLSIPHDVFQVLPCSFEVDADCLAVLQHRHPGLIRGGSVNSTSKAWFGDLIHRTQPHCCLLAGGSPCQHLSQLAGCREGLSGKDSQLFWQFASAKTSLDELLRATNTPFFWLLENVLMDAKFPHVISATLGCCPMLLNAADTGWHQRRRLCWLNWGMSPFLQRWITHDAHNARFQLKIPRVHRHLPLLTSIFKGGWFPKFLKESASEEFPEGRLPTISRPLKHGTRPRGWTNASSAARVRFQEAGLKFPVYHFEDSSLIWKGQQARLPSSDEKELLFGMPASHTRVPASGTCPPSNYCLAVSRGFVVCRVQTGRPSSSRQLNCKCRCRLRTL